MFNLFKKKKTSAFVKYESDPKKVLDFLPRIYLNHSMFKNLEKHTRGYHIVYNADAEAMETTGLARQYNAVVNDENLVHIGYVFFEEPLDLKGNFAAESAYWLKTIKSLHTETPFRKRLRKLRYWLFRT